jgi:hypothetical protein
LGGDFFDQQHPVRTQNGLVRRLERLGLQVVVVPSKPAPDAASLRRSRGRRVNVSNAELIANTSGYKLLVFEGTGESERVTRGFTLANLG